MATKAQQNDDGTVSDPVTTETQRGYANNEADLKKRQEEMIDKDAKTKSKGKAIVKGATAIKDKIVDAVTTRNALVPTGLIPAKDMYDAKRLSDPAYKDAGYKKGGKVSSASKRADGIAIRGKTRA